MDQIQDFFNSTIGERLLNLLAALAVIIIGYLIARILAGITRKLLNKVDFDNRIAKRMSDDFDLPNVDIEYAAGTVVFWLVILFAIFGAIQRLNLTGVTAVFSPLLTQITSDYIPGIVGAILLGLLAWVIAFILRAIVLKLCQWGKLDERLNKQGATDGSEPLSISEALGTATFWLVFLVFIPAILESLGISAISEPFIAE